MKFSIIIPVYNVSKYLKDCLFSIVNQSFTDFEVILVNDGSKDNSEEICRIFCTKDTRFSLYSKENGGLVSARKYGLSKAQGDYIVPIDGDDFIAPDYLEQFSDIIDKENPDVIFSNIVKYYSEKKQEPIKMSIKNGFYIYENNYNETLKYFLYDSTSAFPNQGRFLHNLCTKAIKKDIYIDCQEMVPDIIKYGEDLLCTTYILFKMRSYYVSNYCGYYYRQSETSMCLHFDENAFNDYNNTIKQLLLTTLEKNKIYVFALVNLITLISNCAKNSKNYKEFILTINNSFACKYLWESAQRAQISNPTFNSKVKIYLLKHQKYLIIFLFYRYFNTNY